MPIDSRKFKQKITEHFQNLTPEEFLKLLSQSSPHLFDDSREESQDTEILDLAAPTSNRLIETNLPAK